jgi:hypothetical protein
MMMTVKQYVDDRQSSETTVKRHIKKLNLDLPINPLNKKQRLISIENQQRLDASLGCQSSTPIAAVAEVIEVTPYQRSEEVGMIIAEGEILKAQHLIPYQPTAQNPLLLALQQQAAQMQQANQARYAQIQQDSQTQQESQQAIAAAKRIRLMEQAQQEAFEAHQLKKQLIAKATNDLEMYDLGFPPVNQTPEPTPQPRPQSQPSSPQPSWL